ncbi:MAG: HEAT repeat domain-containing protein [Coleofasciculus sp. C2-GNP5-27]
MQDTRINKLIEKCASGEPKEQALALQELVKMKADSAVPVILELLHSSDEGIRFCAAEALGDLGEKEIESVGSALINLLVDPKELVRSGATDSLGILAYKPARDSIESLLLNDSAPLVRASAAETLGDLGDPDALDTLKSAMQDPDEAVRSYAANSLGLVGKPDLLPQLQTYIESEDSLEVKAELLAAKYRLGDTEAMKSLLTFLENADEDLATVMLNILGDLIDRKIPLTITSDASEICQVLNLLEKRFPLLARHSQNIIAKLALLKSQSNNV